MNRKLAGTGTLLGLVSALAGPVAAQEATRSQIGLGVGVTFADLATFAGPAIGGELGRRGIFSLRADVSAVARVRDSRLKVVNPNVPDSGYPGFYDSRPLLGMGIAALALEAGNRDRHSNGGPFAAARVGVAGARWGRGYISRGCCVNQETYEVSRRTAAMLLVGGDLGLMIPAFGRSNRIAVRVEGLHEAARSETHLTLVLLRRW